MLPIHTILHPTDFSERSEHAFRLACALARDYEACLIVMHAWTRPSLVYGESLPYPDGDWLAEEADKNLRQIQVSSPGLQLERLLIESDAVPAILRIADERQVDLIVMGSHGRSGLRRFLMGSVAEQVLRRAACPVVTVQSPFHEMTAATSSEEAHSPEELLHHLLDA
jgi:nucleotide-binding universal stress UspA family protein